jgi:hypothetical protein
MSLRPVSCHESDESASDEEMIKFAAMSTAQFSHFVVLVEDGNIVKGLAYQIKRRVGKSMANML